MSEILTPTNFAGLKIQKPKTEGIERINMLVYGEAGVGKTWLAGSASAVPEMRNVLYLDAEGGSVTLREWPDVQMLQTKEWNDYIRIHQALKTGQHMFQTVVLDSLSEINEQNREQVMQEMKLAPDNEDRDEDVPSLREWGKMQVRLLRLIRMYRDLPMNVIFIAHAERVKLNSGKHKWMPLLNGKTQMKVPQIPDLVFFMYNQEVEQEQRRLLLTAQTDNATAKVRGCRMPAVIGDTETVTMQTILNYYKANKETK